MKRKHNDKTIQYTPIELIGKLVTPGLLVTVSRLATHIKQA